MDVLLRRPPPGAVPSLLRDMSWAALLFLLVADATVLEILLYKNSHHKGTCLHYYFQTVCLYYAYRLAYSILVADAEFFDQVLLGGECDDHCDRYSKH